MKKFKIIIFFVVLISFITYYVSSFIYLPNNKYIYNKIVNTYNISNVEIKKSNIAVTEEYLDYYYYETSNLAGFSGGNIENNFIDGYKTFWALKLNEFNLLNEDAKDKIITLYKEFRKKPQGYDDFTLLNYDSYLYKINTANIDPKYINHEYINKILNKNYDAKTNLFFWNNENDSLENKLSATYNALQIIKHTNCEFININKIKEALIKLYLNEDYFKKKSIKEELGTTTALIIMNLDELEVNYNTIPLANERVAWIDYWNNKIDSLSENDKYSLVYFQQLMECNHFFNKKNVVSNDYFNKLIKSNLVVKNNKLISADFQTIYYLCIVANYNNIKISEEQYIKKFLQNQISYNFSKPDSTSFQPFSNYYGLVLSDKYGYRYDVEKARRLVKSFKSKYVDTANIEKINDINNLYYTILNCKLLNIEIEDKKILEHKLNSYLKKIINNFISSNYANDNIEESLRGIQFAIFSLNLIDKSISSSLRKDLITIINTKIKIDNIISYSSLDSLIDINEYLNKSRDKKIIANKIKNRMTSFYTNEGGFKNKSDSNDVDIISTYICSSYLKKNFNNSFKLYLNLNSYKNSRNLFSIGYKSRYSDTNVVFFGIKLEAFSREGDIIKNDN